MAPAVPSMTTCARFNCRFNFRWIINHTRSDKFRQGDGCSVQAERSGMNSLYIIVAKNCRNAWMNPGYRLKPFIANANG